MLYSRIILTEEILGGIRARLAIMLMMVKFLWGVGRETPLVLDVTREIVWGVEFIFLQITSVNMTGNPFLIFSCGLVIITAFWFLQNKDFLKFF